MVDHFAPTPQKVDEEAAKAALEPTEAPREVGSYRKGQINIGDLDVTIETAKGALVMPPRPTRAQGIKVSKVVRWQVE